MRRFFNRRTLVLIGPFLPVILLIAVPIVLCLVILLIISAPFAITALFLYVLFRVYRPLAYRFCERMCVAEDLRLAYAIGSFVSLGICLCIVLSVALTYL
jgi:hypothetical protein